MGMVFLAGLATTVQAAAADLEVPFELVKGVPLVELSLGGSSPLNFIVDTGVTPSVVNLETARAAGLDLPETPSGEASGSGKAQSVPVYATTLKGLSIAGQAQDAIEAVAVDTGAIGAALGRTLHGILGYSFLAGKVVEFDYPRSRLRVLDAVPAPREGEEYWTQPLQLRAGDVMPLLEVRVNGLPIRVTLDTGSSGGLGLFPPGWMHLGLDQQAQAGTETVRTGARGEHTVREGTVESITIGPFDATHTAVSFTDRGADDGTRDGNLGGAILKDFVVMLDYRGGKIRFSKPQ